MKSIIDGGRGFSKSLLRQRSSLYLIDILTEHNRGNDTHLDSASIAKVRFLLHASVGSDTR